MPTPKSSAACNKVSAGSVSSIVGNTLPLYAPYSSSTVNVAGGVFEVTVICDYGLGQILNDVAVQHESNSKPSPFVGQSRQSFKRAFRTPSLRCFVLRLRPRRHRHVLTVVDGGDVWQSIDGYEGGLISFGASVHSKSSSRFPKSKLVELAKLAQRL